MIRKVWLNEDELVRSDQIRSDTDKMMMMTKKTNNNGRIPKLEKELQNRIVGHEMVQLDQEVVDSLLEEIDSQVVNYKWTALMNGSIELYDFKVK